MSAARPRIVVLAWSVTAAYWLGIFVLTHLPPHRVPRTRVSDTHAHFAAYAALTALLLWSLHFTNLSSRAAAWWVVAIGLFYGVIDELLQIPVNRICSVQDWVADATGVMTVVALFVVIGAVRHTSRA